MGWGMGGWEAGALQEAVGGVSLGEDVIGLLRDARVMLREECELVVSDRRLKKAARLLKVRSDCKRNRTFDSCIDRHLRVNALRPSHSDWARLLEARCI